VEIQYYGGNCIKISTKKFSVVVDDNLAELGQKSIVAGKDIALYTSRLLKPVSGSHFDITEPGEYEVSDVSIQGVPARAHMDEEKTYNATMYRIIIDDVRIAVVGHIFADLDDDQLEALGTIDILFVPVGNSGYTLDGMGAQKVIKEVEPKLVIPTHYAEKGLNYEVPQVDLETALKEIGIEPHETMESLKIKNLELSDTTKLVVLTRK
jgi:L-ascorbate metabolism protein UlaG (beta-lactamase superfamily)